MLIVTRVITVIILLSFIQVFFFPFLAAATGATVRMISLVIFDIDIAVLLFPLPRETHTYIKYIHIFDLNVPSKLVFSRLF